MTGTPFKNLRMFEELCGKNAFKNIILTTTMWDKVDKEKGEDRERQLKQEYWRTMLERNSTTSRFLRTRESAFEVIEPLIDEANKGSSVLLQNELVEMKKSLPATAAGLKLFSEMGQLVSQREDLLRRIRKEMRRSDGDKMTLEPLQEEHQNLQNSLETMAFEMQRLHLPLGKRFSIMANKFFSSKFKSLISKMGIPKYFYATVTNEGLEIYRRRRQEGDSEKLAINTNDLSQDIIIACVIARSYFIRFECLYVASWAQLVLGKAL
jgi:hypothetical protein